MRRAWERFRGWATWVQVAVSVVAALLVIGAVVPDEEPDTAVATKSDVADELPFATTTMREQVVTSTTAAPTTTTTATPTTTTVAPTTTTTAPPPPPPPTTAAPLVQRAAPANDCHPSYDPCVPNASDVDCAGGSGNGPAYTGMVTVIGPDVYDLDRDGDGVGCE